MSYHSAWPALHLDLASSGRQSSSNSTDSSEAATSYSRPPPVSYSTYHHRSPYQQMSQLNEPQADPASLSYPYQFPPTHFQPQPRSPVAPGAPLQPRNPSFDQVPSPLGAQSRVDQGRYRLTTSPWDDQGTFCYQVDVKGQCVARRGDSDAINGTKLLNVVGLTRGKRDGILKNQKGRVVQRVGHSHLKGVWIPFSNAQELAEKYNIADLLFPLLEADIKPYLNPMDSHLRSRHAFATANAQAPPQSAYYQQSPYAWGGQVNPSDHFSPHYPETPISPTTSLLDTSNPSAVASPALPSPSTNGASRGLKRSAAEAYADTPYANPTSTYSSTSDPQVNGTVDQSESAKRPKLDSGPTESVTDSGPTVADQATHAITTSVPAPETSRSPSPSALQKA